MASEKKIRANLIVQRVSFVFVSLILFGGAAFCIYFIVWSRAYRYEIFWVAALAELILLLLYIKLPHRGIYQILRLLIWFIALLGPAAISSLSPSYGPARFAFFVLFLGISLIGIPRFFHNARKDIKKLEAQLGRIKAGLPIEDELPFKVSGDETIALKRKFNTFIERTYTTQGNTDSILQKIQRHFKQSGYKQAGANGTIIFTRGRGPYSYSPRDWLSMATVRIMGESETVKVDLWLGVDLKGQIVMPWERAFWRAELKDFEKTLSLIDSFRESEKANKKAIWMNLGTALGELILIIGVVLGIILSIMFIADKRYQYFWGIAGLAFIAVLIFAIVSWVRKRTKVLW